MQIQQEKKQEGTQLNILCVILVLFDFKQYPDIHNLKRHINSDIDVITFPQSKTTKKPTQTHKTVVMLLNGYISEAIEWAHVTLDS